MSTKELGEPIETIEVEPIPTSVPEPEYVPEAEPAADPEKVGA